MAEVVDLRCPNCNTPISIDTKECIFCHQAINVSTFNSVYDMTPLQLNKHVSTYRKALTYTPDDKDLNLSIAFCYLRLKMYDKALPAFDKAIEDNFDNSEAYFYAAVCLLKGKKAFLTPRAEIDKIEEYINAANMIEPKGIYYYFLAYIKYDYFYRKSFNTSPNYVEALQMAVKQGLPRTDVAKLYDILGVACPDPLKVL